jgi:hypothetical protein
MSPENSATRPTSQKRIEANRRNARKSTGPRTVEGKSIVRRNALRHGLAAEELVVLGEDAEEFQRMADAHLAAFRPQNDVELELAGTFTLAAWRRRRCVSTEAAMTNQHIRDSALAEKTGEEQDVLNLGDRLFHDSQHEWQLFPDPGTKNWPRFPRKEVPGDPDQPARLVKQLESTYAGCRWLLARWKELRAQNESGNFWTALEKFKAVRLLGKNPIAVLDESNAEVLSIFLACHEIFPTNNSPFSELQCEVHDMQYPNVRKRLEQTHAHRHRARGEEEGRRMLDALIDNCTERLKRLARKHKKRARAEAAERIRRLAFDPGEEADKVRRYEDIAVRRMTRACEELIKLRRAGILDEAIESEAASSNTGGISHTSPTCPRREDAGRAGEGAARKPGESTNDMSVSQTSPSPPRGEGARRAGEGARVQLQHERLNDLPDVRLESLTYQASPPRGEDARRAGEGAAQKPAEPTNNTGVSQASPSPQPGEGARRAGEGAAHRPGEVKTDMSHNSRSPSQKKCAASIELASAPSSSTTEAHTAGKADRDAPLQQSRTYEEAFRMRRAADIAAGVPASPADEINVPVERPPDVDSTRGSNAPAAPASPTPKLDWYNPPELPKWPFPRGKSPLVVLLFAIASWCFIARGWGRENTTSPSYEHRTTKAQPPAQNKANCPLAPSPDRPSCRGSTARRRWTATVAPGSDILAGVRRDEMR